MNRRIIYYLAAAALLLAGVAGALGYRATPTLAYGQPMDEVEFDLAPTPGGDVASGLEIISGNDRAVAEIHVSDILVTSYYSAEQID